MYTIQILTGIRNHDTSFRAVKESTSQYIIVHSLDHANLAFTLGCNSKKAKIPNLLFEPSIPTGPQTLNPLHLKPLLSIFFHRKLKSHFRSTWDTFARGFSRY